ncbi:conserved hypothetical protein [methanotrophic bacterial endosymbiont of Bathymodiolus sp.]|nr:conserved hypothetical protein [methanotrophic bacterial endosymbiont of Bathymodiolus sp.]
MHVICIDKVTFLFPHETRGLKTNHAIGVLPFFDGMVCHDHWFVFNNTCDRTANASFNPNAIEEYGLRWEIENLFGCLEDRGFNLEDTRVVGVFPYKKVICITCYCFLLVSQRERMEKLLCFTYKNQNTSTTRIKHL